MFLSMFIMVYNDNNNYNDIRDRILDNTSVKNIDYVNYYDNYYIVCDNEFLYLFNDSFEEISKIDISLISDNKNDYDIIYMDKAIVYMNDYNNKDNIVYEYYDLYTYKLIDKIVVGGN